MLAGGKTSASITSERRSRCPEPAARFPLCVHVLSNWCRSRRVSSLSHRTFGSPLRCSQASRCLSMTNPHNTKLPLLWFNSCSFQFLTWLVQLVGITTAIESADSSSKHTGSENGPKLSECQAAEMRFHIFISGLEDIFTLLLPRFRLDWLGLGKYHFS